MFVACVELHPSGFASRIKQTWEMVWKCQFDSCGAAVESPAARENGLNMLLCHHLNHAKCSLNEAEWNGGSSENHFLSQIRLTVYVPCPAGFCCCQVFMEAATLEVTVVPEQSKEAVNGHKHVDIN